MSFISITNTFASATLIESGKVNQNFIDFKTGLSDGLHDISMAAGVFNEPLLVASGIAGTPGLAFKNSPTTGLYSPAADVTGFSNKGTEVGRIGSAGTWHLGYNGIIASHNVYGHTNFHDGVTIVSGVVKVASGITITSGDLDVDGAMRLKSNLTITSGNLHVDGTAAIRSAVTLTNGPLTVDGPASFKSAVTISSGNLFLDGYQDIKKTSAPSSASAGTLRVYGNSDDLLHAVTENGIDYPIGTSSGQGTKNYITNPSAKINTTGMTAIDGNITIARDTTTAIPRYTTTGTAFKLTSSTDEKYAYFRFTLDDVDQNKKLGISLAQSVAVASQYRVEVYTNSASDYSGSYVELALSSDVSGDSYFPIGDGTFTSSFDSGIVPYIEVRLIHNGTDNTAAYFSDIVVSPDYVKQGAVVTDWQSYTPTFTGFGIVSVYDFSYRRVGNVCEIQGRFTSGTPTSVEAKITLPNGLNSAISTTSKVVGSGARDQAGAIDYHILSGSAGPGYLGMGRSFTSDVAFSRMLGDALLAAGHTISFFASIPILEWQGSGTLNIADVSNKARRTKVVDLTITGPSTVHFAKGYAYCDSNGVYKLNFNAELAFSPASADPSIAITGITFRDVNTAGQAIDAIASNTGTWRILTLYRANDNTNTISIGTDVGVVMDYAQISGDVFLKEKPTWFDANVETNDWQPVGFGYVSANSSGLMPSTNASLDDVTATRLGLKQYLHGTSYNGGNAPTVTGVTPVRAVFVPYQMQDGIWRVRCNIVGTLSSNSLITISINGITFTSGYDQACAVQGGGPVSGNASSNGGTNGIGCAMASNVTTIRVSGDFELASKPSWAY